MTFTDEENDKIGQAPSGPLAGQPFVTMPESMTAAECAEMLPAVADKLSPERRRIIT